jgi:hypothetical protein
MLEESQEYHLNRALALLSSDKNLTDPEYLKNNADKARGLYKDHAKTLDKLSRSLYAAPNKLQEYKDLVQWAEQQAKAGCKVIVIDPITAVKQSAKPWIEDTNFLERIKTIARDYSIAVLLTTHPKKGQTAPGLDDLAGGAAYQRFAQSVLWLQPLPKTKTLPVKTPCGTEKVMFNRALHIAKARNGRGNAVIAYRFFMDNEWFGFSEQGIIID